MISNSGKNVNKIWVYAGQYYVAIDQLWKRLTKFGQYFGDKIIDFRENVDFGPVQKRVDVVDLKN